MIETTRETFWRSVMLTEYNIHPTPTGRYPFTTEWAIISGPRNRTQWGRVETARAQENPSTIVERFFIEPEFIIR
jgi:hypothetical protein